MIGVIKQDFQKILSRNESQNVTNTNFPRLTERPEIKYSDLDTNKA